jgi:hypothetical protein
LNNSGLGLVPHHSSFSKNYPGKIFIINLNQSLFYSPKYIFKQIKKVENKSKAGKEKEY